MVSITQSDIVESVTGGPTAGNKAKDRIRERLFERWGFEEREYEEEALIPLSAKWTPRESPAERIKQATAETYRDKRRKRDGAEGAVLAAAGVVDGYEQGKNAALDKAVTKAGPIDRNVVEEATPIQYDPRIMAVLRSEAPIVGDIPQVGQAGFTASYNVISGRDEPVGFLSENEAIDLSEEKDSDHSLSNDEKDMKIWVDKANISDFTARAESSLGYMDVTQMTMGARVAEHALQKARAIFYGDPSANSGNNDAQDSAAYEGIAKIASDAGNDVDKSGFSSSSDYPILTDLKRELTKAVVDTGLTYNVARIAVGSKFFDEIENELNLSVRKDDFSEATVFGGRALNLKNGVPIREYPNIREYPSFNSANFTPSDRDVFIYDSRGIQFRSLMPLTTVPLARVGLANRAALAEFGTLISKDQGEHTHYLSNYAE
jgi:hypothetical protein